MFSPSGIESCGSEPAKAKKITSRKKSADSSSSFSEDPKMIFSPFRNRETEESSQGHQTPIRQKIARTEPPEKKGEKKRKRLRPQEQRGTQKLAAPPRKRRKNSTGGPPTSKPTPEFASRKRAKKEGEKNSRTGWMDLNRFCFGRTPLPPAQ
jgi:hypothetical protein